MLSQMPMIVKSDRGLAVLCTSDCLYCPSRIGESVPGLLVLDIAGDVRIGDQQLIGYCT